MRHSRQVGVAIAALVVLLAVARSSSADPAEVVPGTWLSSSERVRHDPWKVSWQRVNDSQPEADEQQQLAAPEQQPSRASDQQPSATDQNPSPATEQQPLHAAAIQHSDGYLTRQKIHKYASFATLPLLGAQLALGQSLYSGSGASGQRTAHAWVGAGIVSLFGVNTVTGAWNLFGEGRQETEGRTLRLVHGLLMMVADAGFVATTISTPSGRNRRSASTYQASATTHRNLAVFSISVATGSYLLMLFGNH